MTKQHPDLPATELNGRGFHRFQLEPFGERWIPKEGGSVLVDSWAQEDIAAVVHAVRQARFIVLHDTAVSSAWNHIAADNNELTQVPHADNGLDVQVHLLHSEDGNRRPTAYTNDTHLTPAIRKLLPELKQIFESAPAYLQERCFLTGEYSLLDYLETTTGTLSNHLLVDVMERLYNDLSRLNQQLRGWTWIAGQNTKQVREEHDGTFYLYSKLIEFYLKVINQARKYVHKWTDNPKSTVLSAHNLSQRISSPQEIVQHCRYAVGENVPYESNLRRNYIIGGEDAYYSGEKYRLGYREVPDF